jgi:hypothetical protein
MPAEDAVYSLEDAVIAQMALRRAAGDVVAKLGLSGFIEAICGEIDMLRNTGLSDDEIAAVVERATGRPMTPGALGQCRPKEGFSNMPSIPALAEPSASMEGHR